MSVGAVQHIRRMRGGAQSQMLRCSDGHYYIVKFQNNPQHLRILANEMLGTRLAESLGLPVPVTNVIEVDRWLIDQNPALNIQLAHCSTRCEAGLQFGSRYVVDPLNGTVFDYLPVEMLHRVRNAQVFAGILVFDKWTGNSDGRQTAFWRRSTQRKYTPAFIDQGNCFNGGKWSFPDHPLSGAYCRNEVYSEVRNWDSFEPWISQIENMEVNQIWKIAIQIPSEWYSHDLVALEKLIADLDSRRRNVRKLVNAFRMSARNPFPQWSGLSQFSYRYHQVL